MNIMKIAVTTIGCATVLLLNAGTSTWKGGNGKWSDVGNWEGGVPNENTTTIVFSDVNSTIDNDSPIVIPADVKIEVCEGAAVTLTGTVAVGGIAYKDGLGKLIFRGLLRCPIAVTPSSLTRETAVYGVAIDNGEVELAADVTGVRIFGNNSDETVSTVLRISDGATITQYASVHATWKPGETGYGTMVMDGGLVEMNSGRNIFSDASQKKWALVALTSGSASVVINGGTFRFPTESQSGLVSLGDGGYMRTSGSLTITVNGGLLDFSQKTCYVACGSKAAALEKIVLNGGQINAGSLTEGLNNGYFEFDLNGGTLNQTTENGNNVLSIGRRCAIHLDGTITLAQSADRNVMTIKNPTVGAAGAIVQNGVGRVVLTVDSNTDIQSIKVVAGTFVKNGVGVMNVCLSGSEGLVTLEDGSVSLGAVDNSMLELDVSLAENIAVSTDEEPVLKSLTVAGQKAFGRVNVSGDRTVFVAMPGWTMWKGGEGGSWNDAANWIPAGVPAAEGSKLFFDVSANISDNTVTVPADTEIYVSQEKTVSFSGTVMNPAVLTKSGSGKAVFSGLLRSVAEPASLTKATATSAMCVVEGEAEISGEVKGLRIHPCASTEAADAVVRISEGAVITQFSSVNLPWVHESGVAGYGKVIQDGGTVNLDSGREIFSGSANKYSLMSSNKGRGELIINGGTFAFPKAQIAVVDLDFAWSRSDGFVTITVNGGELDFPGADAYFALSEKISDTLVINGGIVAYNKLSYGMPGCKFELKLNGGTFRQVGKVTNNLLTGCKAKVEVGGRTVVEQPSDWIQEISVPLSGEGTLVQNGQGSLRIVNCPAGIEIAAGSLLVDDAVQFDETKTVVSVAKGAILQLDNTIMKSIKELHYDGRQRRAGIYSAAGAGRNYIRGDGALNVLEGDASGLILLFR